MPTDEEVKQAIQTLSGLVGSNTGTTLVSRGMYVSNTTGQAALLDIIKGLEYVAAQPVYDKLYPLAVDIDR